MTEAEAISELIQRLLPNVKRGTLRLWGEWIGKPYDNLLFVALDIDFDEGEVLPVGWAKVFVQGDALDPVADRRPAVDPLDHGSLSRSVA